jgi:hypothetical protein
VKLVTETIACKRQEKAADTGNWKWLKIMLETYGQDGTSSDESDREGAIETAYYAKAMPWRRNIENELKLVDDENRRLATTQVRRGAKPVTRQRRSGIVSTRDPVARLPIDCYDERWIATKSDLFIRKTLKVSNERLMWRELTIQ